MELYGLWIFQLRNLWVKSRNFSWWEGNQIKVIIQFSFFLFLRSFWISLEHYFFNFTRLQIATQVIFFVLFLFERAIFQIFLKTYCCTKSLFFELETSNFGYLLVFWFPLKVRQSQKQIGHIQNGWYSTKIIWTVQNQFGPIEGQGISLKNKGLYPH